MTGVIHAENLTKRYGNRRGVEQIQLEIQAGQIFGFLGPNGAGKTTTIRLLLGLVRATAGQARVFGLHCWQQSHQIKHVVGYLPGDLRLYSWMTATDALQIFGKVRRMNLMRAGIELADRFRLEMDLKIRKMSRGTRQKVGLVLAMAHRPKLLILDEPTSGLDPLMQDELARLLRERAGQGDTIFFSSHTLSEVSQLCDRIAIVRDGRIAADETIAELRRRAPRSVTLFFSEQAGNNITPPDFLTDVIRHGRRWQAKLLGPAQPLIRWASQQSIEDIDISQPDLDTLFRSYYEPAEGRN